eukprot:TRINITY_DN424_c0_g1_i28.p1 TRINITY_DN424_c0_g1~~TRINITY_DN424_c0_g1_i28.p1  ORF type:complete len:854 (-),score=121.28 TRINITY_DN424_c0_g1_i28:305-2866(-)
MAAMEGVVYVLNRESIHAILPCGTGVVVKVLMGFEEGMCMCGDPTTGSLYVSTSTSMFGEAGELWRVDIAKEAPRARRLAGDYFGDTGHMLMVGSDLCVISNSGDMVLVSPETGDTTRLTHDWEPDHDWGDAVACCQSSDPGTLYVATSCGVLSRSNGELYRVVIGEGKYRTWLISEGSWGSTTAMVLLPQDQERRLDLLVPRPEFLANLLDSVVTEEQLNALFDHYDRDMNGCLSNCELRALWRDLVVLDDTHPITPQAIGLMAARSFARMDTGQNGLVDRGEFVRELSGSKLVPPECGAGSDVQWEFESKGAPLILLEPVLPIQDGALCQLRPVSDKSVQLAAKNGKPCELVSVQGQPNWWRVDHVGDGYCSLTQLSDGCVLSGRNGLGGQWKLVLRESDRSSGFHIVSEEGKVLVAKENQVSLGNQLGHGDPVLQAWHVTLGDVGDRQDVVSREPENLTQRLCQEGALYVFTEHLHACSKQGPGCAIEIDSGWGDTKVVASDSDNGVLYVVTSSGLFPSTGAIWRIAEDGVARFGEESVWGQVRSAGCVLGQGRLADARSRVVAGRLHVLLDDEVVAFNDLAQHEVVSRGWESGVLCAGNRRSMYGVRQGALVHCWYDQGKAGSSQFECAAVSQPGVWSNVVAMCASYHHADVLFVICDANLYSVKQPHAAERPLPLLSVQEHPWLEFAHTVCADEDSVYLVSTTESLVAPARSTIYRMNLAGTALELVSERLLGGGRIRALGSLPPECDGFITPKSDFLRLFQDRPLKRWEIERIWSWYDRDGNGTLDRAEIEAFYRDLLAVNGTLLAPDVIARVAVMAAKRMDTDQNGSVDHQEFVSYLEGHTLKLLV